MPGVASLAEDAAQEAFAVACRILSTLQDVDRFPQWLGTICRRTASRLDRERPRYEPLAEDWAPARIAESPSPQRHVHEALEQLDGTAREIVLLHYFSGLSYEAISDVVGLSTQAIHGRLQRARRKLAEFLQPNGAEP